MQAASFSHPRPQRGSYSDHTRRLGKPAPVSWIPRDIKYVWRGPEGAAGSSGRHESSDAGAASAARQRKHEVRAPCEKALWCRHSAPEDKISFILLHLKHCSLAATTGLTRGTNAACPARCGRRCSQAPRRLHPSNFQPLSRRSVRRSRQHSWDMLQTWGGVAGDRARKLQHAPPRAMPVHRVQQPLGRPLTTGASPRS